MLGMSLSKSGGAAVEAAAKTGDPNVFSSFFTIPMQSKINCDFSYAGMKSSFRLAVQAARTASGVTDAAAIMSTNAPASQMQESPAPVVAPSFTYCLPFVYT